MLSIIFKTLIGALAAELAPLDSIYHDFAKYKVDIVFGNDFQTKLGVWAPERCRIFVPKTYDGCIVEFFPWEEDLPLDINAAIDVSKIKHNLYD